ncbi:hypothetical protein ACTFIW_002719 [Dictyostelium discoideum]
MFKIFYKIYTIIKK